MPTSLIVVALVVAWLVVLVPMIVRKRQEVAKTADTELAARVVRPAREEFTMAAEHDDPEDLDDRVDHADLVDDEFDEAVGDDEPQRRYRPGRGGFDPQAAALAAKAKYAFRQRVVVTMILSAIITAVVAGVSVTPVWWVHGAIDVALVTYLGYLRRQVRIEEEIRERRLARMSTVRRSHAHPRPEMVAETAVEDPEPRREHGILTQPAPTSHHGAVVVDLDDEDPAFDELDEPDVLPYRRAVGE
ncbi:gephyrin-like molybdotransferase receptor GlpR [Labedaea rhizosphaerae]|uniref:Uncharacterized protein n=1 Tax=Labedaea rhizosphaerae TaxID=598644 RepID=A0A4R6SJU4_LABRH|nr:gephyrin-like molybdotransferase receptor GlpR [Labedaea rhizosphaerae]TDQ04329.1 hypothetical protein EV186_101274 [Labedaea rhizosphaerae]